MHKILIRLIFISLIFSLTHTKSFAQKGYYSKDTVFVSGVKVNFGTDKDNAHFIEIVRGGKATTFYPKDIDEYGKEKFKRYYSKNVQIDGSDQQLFLERLSTGQIDLFYYKQDKNHEYYFAAIDEEHTLNLLNTNSKEETKNSIKSLFSGCKYSADQIENVTLNKNSIKAIFDIHNSCEPKNLPYPKLWVEIGFGNSNFHNSSNTPPFDAFNVLENVKGNGFSAGIKVQLPLSYQNFSLLTGISINENKLVTHQEFTSTQDIRFENNLFYLTLPLSVRYNLPNNNIRPFFDIGGSYNYFLKNENELYTIIKDNENASVISISDNLMSKSQFGFVAQAGISINNNYKNDINIGIQYEILLGGEKSLSINKLSLNAGFSF